MYIPAFSLLHPPRHTHHFPLSVLPKHTLRSTRRNHATKSNQRTHPPSTPTSTTSTTTTASGFPVPSPTYRNFGSTPKGAYVNKRNGVQTDGQKSAKTTISPTQSAITSPGH